MASQFSFALLLCAGASASASAGAQATAPAVDALEQQWHREVSADGRLSVSVPCSAETTERITPKAGPVIMCRMDGMAYAASSVVSEKELGRSDLPADFDNFIAEARGDPEISDLWMVKVGEYRGFRAIGPAADVTHLQVVEFRPGELIVLMATVERGRSLAVEQRAAAKVRALRFLDSLEVGSR